MAVHYPASSRLSHVRIVQASPSLTLSVVCSALLSFIYLVHPCSSLLRLLAVYNMTELVVVLVVITVPAVAVAVVVVTDDVT
jgi:hypothetical protein